MKNLRLYKQPDFINPYFETWSRLPGFKKMTGIPESYDFCLRGFGAGKGNILGIVYPVKPDFLEDHYTIFIKCKTEAAKHRWSQVEKVFCFAQKISFEDVWIAYDGIYDPK